MLTILTSFHGNDNIFEYIIMVILSECFYVVHGDSKLSNFYIEINICSSSLSQFAINCKFVYVNVPGVCIRSCRSLCAARAYLASLVL